MAFLTQLYTNTLSNQNISSALLVGTYTNTSRIRKVYVTVACDQIAGNGNYTCYATVQRAGAGSAYQASPLTTAAVASGVTAIIFESIPITLNATDVLKIYVLGLAGDTTTPDLIVDVNEEFVLTDSSGNVTFSNTSIATVTTLTNAPNDSSGVTTLLARLAQAILFTGAGNVKVDALLLNGATPNNLASSDVQSAMTAQGYTTTRAGYLDTLNNLISNIWSNAQRLLTAGTNIVLAKGTGITGFNDLNALGVRDAMKLAPSAGAPAATSIDDKLNALVPGAAIDTTVEITETHISS